VACFYATLLNTSTFNETNLEASFGSIIIIFEVGMNLLIEIIMLNGLCCLLYPTNELCDLSDPPGH
jgi:hypothetical protein